MTLKQETADIIEKFADKSLTFGCMVEKKGTGGTDVTGLYGDTDWIISKSEGNITTLWDRGMCHKDDIREFYEIIGHPVMIGTVLKYMETIEPIDEDEFRKMDFHKTGDGILIKLWRRCGIDKSLNEIFGGEVWNHYETLDEDRPIIGIKGHLKDPNAQALLEFIKTL